MKISTLIVTLALCLQVATSVCSANEPEARCRGCGDRGKLILLACDKC